MRYVRVLAGPDGESHFEDVEINADHATGAQLSAQIPASGVIFRRVSARDDPTTPHVAPRRQFVVLLEGELEVEVSDGEVRRFGAGGVLLVEDTAGRGHVTRALGGHDRITLFIPLADQPESRD